MTTKEQRERELLEPGADRQLSELLEILGPGILTLLALYLQSQREPLSELIKMELTKRIYHGSELEGEDWIRALLASVSFVNREMIPELIAIKVITEELLEETGADPLLTHIDTQLYKLESHIEEEEETAEDGNGAS